MKSNIKTKKPMKMYNRDVILYYKKLFIYNAAFHILN